MRKETFAFLVGSVLSLAALARSGETTTSGDPVREAQIKPSQGDWNTPISLFSFFRFSNQHSSSQPDTLRIVVSMPRIKEDTRRPK